MTPVSPPLSLLQEQFLRSVLFENHFGFLSASGYEVDEEARTRSQKEQQELLMKMFAVSRYYYYYLSDQLLQYLLQNINHGMMLI